MEKTLFSGDQLMMTDCLKRGMTILKEVEFSFIYNFKINL